MLKSVQEEYLECLIILIENKFEKPAKLKKLFQQLNLLSQNQREITEISNVDLDKIKLALSARKEVDKNENFV
jgi:DNA-directed RNA polymerase specialized sigma54-like protein